MHLILKCINNHPQARAHAGEIVERLTEMVLQFPASFANRLEMLRQIEADREEKRALTEERERKSEIIQSQISSLGEEVQAKEEQKIAEVDQLKVVHSSEVKQLQLQVRDLNTQKQLLKAENKAETIEFKSKITALENQVETLLQEKEQSEGQWTEARKQHEIAIAEKGKARI